MEIDRKEKQIWVGKELEIFWVKIPPDVYKSKNEE